MLGSGHILEPYRSRKLAMEIYTVPIVEGGGVLQALGVFSSKGRSIRNVRNEKGRGRQETKRVCSHRTDPLWKGSSKRLVFSAQKGALFEMFVMKKGRGRQETIVVCLILNYPYFSNLKSHYVVNLSLLCSSSILMSCRFAPLISAFL